MIIMHYYARLILSQKIKDYYKQNHQKGHS
jgi:hypothetical protein